MFYNSSLFRFNQRKTRLRVSITSLCNLNCSFCHKEGLHGYNDVTFMNTDLFKNIIKAYMDIEGKEIDITGGEPLVHPEIYEFLNILQEFKGHTTLSTNGMLLDKVNFDPAVTKIGETKISFHHFDEEKAKKLMGKSYSVKRIKKNVEEHKKKGYQTIINITLTKDNINEIPLILEWCEKIGVHAKVSDLGKTDENANYFSDHYVDPKFIEEYIISNSLSHRVLINNAGNNLIYCERKNGIHFLIKDSNRGKLHTGICKNCIKKEICSEGIFALRVNPNGDYQPCNLCPEHNVLFKNFENISEAQKQAIDIMFSN